MEGFKKFLFRGNLIDLAVAFIIGAAFGQVVTSFTAVVMQLIGKIGGQPNFDAWQPWGIAIGPFLTALVGFVIMAAVVYFLVMKPYEAARDLMTKKEKEAVPAVTSEEVLIEIRDLLKAQQK